MADHRSETTRTDVLGAIRAALRAVLGKDGSEVALVGRWSRVMDHMHRPLGA